MTLEDIRPTLALLLALAAIGTLVAMVWSIRTRGGGVERTAAEEARIRSEVTHRRAEQQALEDSEDEEELREMAEMDNLLGPDVPSLTGECKCEGCGAQVLFHDHETTANCPYCRRVATAATAPYSFSTILAASMGSNPHSITRKQTFHY